MGLSTITPRRLRGWAVVVLLAVYAALTVLVLIPGTFVLRMDFWSMHQHLWYHHPNWWPWIHTYVVFGQRGPSTMAFLPFFIWVAWRQRSLRPLIMLGTALLWLNVSVGVVKYAIGRVGPLKLNNDPHLFDWGNSIFPSGHVANAVVLYGLIAWIAPKFRKTLIGVAIFLSGTVGLGTVYLRSHWFSDVIGGWIAGGLVLLTLPYLMPHAQRLVDHVLARARHWRSERRIATGPALPARARRVPTPPARHAAHARTERELWPSGRI